MQASSRRLRALDTSSPTIRLGARLKPIGLVALAACLGACSSQQAWRSSKALNSPRLYPPTAQATVTPDAAPATIAGGDRQIGARPRDTAPQAAESAITQPPQAVAASGTASADRTAVAPVARSTGEDSAAATPDTVVPVPNQNASASEAQTPNPAAVSTSEPVSAGAAGGPAGFADQSPGPDSGGAQQPDSAWNSSAQAPHQTDSQPGTTNGPDASASAAPASALIGGGEQMAAQHSTTNAGDRGRSESAPMAKAGETPSSTLAQETNGGAATHPAGSTNDGAPPNTASRSAMTENTAAAALSGGVPQPFAEGDSATRSSADQRAAPAEQVAGIVEAPGRTVTSHDVVIPQRLGGLLPMTIGVEGNGEFDFDRAVLREEIKPVLDQLADKLSAADYDRLDIVGHTDRIGTADYNQYLSERRAWAVARYLMTRGVPQAKLHVEGRGTREPITKPEECPFETHEQLIPCLQKDRRVEISASIRKADVQVR
jgi:outer membrane protein OmpA-like peptidoglycan-associated protein